MRVNSDAEAWRLNMTLRRLKVSSSPGMPQMRFNLLWQVSEEDCDLNILRLNATALLIELNCALIKLRFASRSAFKH